MITVSAPGKVHLIGEHAVVYGEPALLVSVGRRLVVKVERSETVRYADKRFNCLHEWTVPEALEAADRARALWAECSEKKDFSPLFRELKKNDFEPFRKAAVGTVLQRLGIQQGVAITIENSGVPPGAGLGSSSSAAAALAKGISEALGKQLNLEEVNSIAFELEQLIHGNPSGGDNTACCYGGLLWFVKGQQPVPLAGEIPFSLEIFVYTKRPEKTTGELVQQVRQLPAEVRDPAVRAIGKGTREMREALKQKDFRRVKDLINLAQENLARLGVSVPEIDRVHEEVKRIGGAAKGCGAVGGGMVLCWHEDRELLLRTLRGLGYEPWEAPLGVEGVRVE